MAFKIYFNKKTRHPSISLSGKEKEIWENMEMTHHPTDKYNYIVIECVSSNGVTTSYVRRYIRKDNRGVKAKHPKRTKLTEKSEAKVKNYLKEAKKKRWWQANLIVWTPLKEHTSSRNIKQHIDGLVKGFSNKKDDSVDWRCRLMDTGELAPTNHLLLF